MSRRQVALLGVVLSFALTILVSLVSENMNPRFHHREETIQQQFAILSGQPILLDGHDLGLREWRGRVLFPLALTNASRAIPRLSVGQWYLTLMATAAFCAFLSFWFLLRQRVKGDVRLAMVGMFLLGYEMLFTYSGGWENTWDFPEIAFTALILWAILGRARLWLVGIVLLATLNREGAVFAGLIWLCVYGLRRGLSVRVGEVAFGVGLSVMAYVEALAVRAVNVQPVTAANAAQADPVYAGQLTHAVSFLNRIAADLNILRQHPWINDWPFLWFAMLTPAVAWIYLNRACLQTVHRRLLVAVAFIVPITVAYGTLDELREYLIPLVILAYVAVALESERTRRAAEPRQAVYTAPARDPVEV